MVILYPVCLGVDKYSQSLIVNIELLHYINKDDNIHKSEALNRYDRRTLTLVECQNYIGFDKIIREFVAKFLNTEYCLRTY